MSSYFISAERKSTFMSAKHPGKIPGIGYIKVQGKHTFTYKTNVV